MFKLLLVGCGARSRAWVQAIEATPEVEILSFVDINPDALAKYKEKYPSVRQYTSLDEAVEKETEADFVLLITPPWVHYEQALKIFDAGLDLLIEKPLALDINEAAEIVRKADETGCRLSVGLNFRYLVVHQEYRKWFLDGRLGDPSYGLFQYSRNRDGYLPRLNRYPLTMPDAMLVDQSIHHFDLMRFVYDSEIATVVAKTWNPSWSMYEYDSVVSTIFEFDNGMYATYLGSWTGGWNELKFQWRTDFSKGVLVQRELFSDLAYANMGDTELTPIPSTTQEPIRIDTQRLLASFVDALAGRQPLECTGPDHLRTLAVTFACQDSRASNKTIHMDEYYKKNGIADLVELPRT